MVFYLVIYTIENEDLANVVMMLALAIVSLLIRRGNLKEDLGNYKRPISLNFFIACVGLTSLISLFAGILTALLDLIFNQFGWIMEIAIDHSGSNQEQISWLPLLYSSILAPVMEEAVYRGSLMTISKDQGKGFAIILTSLLFSLMHGNLAQIPFAFLMGLVLGYLSLEYSLLAAIALHIYNNFILAEVMGFLMDSGPESLGTLSLFLFLSLPAIYAVYYVISRRAKSRPILKSIH